MDFVRAVTEDAIKKMIKTPSTAVFPNRWEDKRLSIFDPETREYHVNAYVDYQNIAGAAIRQRFEARVWVDSVGVFYEFIQHPRLIK